MAAALAVAVRFGNSLDRVAFHGCRMDECYLVWQSGMNWFGLLINVVILVISGRGWISFSESNHAISHQGAIYKYSDPLWMPECPRESRSCEKVSITFLPRFFILCLLVSGRSSWCGSSSEAGAGRVYIGQSRTGQGAQRENFMTANLGGNILTTRLSAWNLAVWWIEPF